MPGSYTSPNARDLHALTVSTVVPVVQHSSTVSTVAPVVQHGTTVETVLLEHPHAHANGTQRSAM